MDLTRRRMPEAAKDGRWPIHLDHCFQRVLLDGATEGVWYDAIRGRPAYRHASDEVLARAVAMGEDALAGRADLEAMNRASLRWRSKAGPRGPGPR